MGRDPLGMQTLQRAILARDEAVKESERLAFTVRNQQAQSRELIRMCAALTRKLIDALDTLRIAADLQSEPGAPPGEPITSVLVLKSELAAEGRDPSLFSKQTLGGAGVALRVRPLDAIAAEAAAPKEPPPPPEPKSCIILPPGVNGV